MVAAPPARLAVGPGLGQPVDEVKVAAGRAMLKRSPRPRGPLLGSSVAGQDLEDLIFYLFQESAPRGFRLCWDEDGSMPPLNRQPLDHMLYVVVGQVLC